MRILDDDDILERFKRGAISDKKFVESMRELPEEVEETDEKKRGVDDRVAIALENIAAILQVMVQKEEDKKPPDTVEERRISGRTVIVHRDDKGLIKSLTLKGETEDGE